MHYSGLGYNGCVLRGEGTYSQVMARVAVPLEYNISNCSMSVIAANVSVA